jgi:hypothetical protein
MSAESAFASPVTRHIDGKEVTFERLKLTDHGQLEADVRKGRVDAARTAADECEVQGKARAEMLAEAANRPIADADVDAYIQTAEGARRAVELSLKRGGVAEPERKSVLDAVAKLEAATIAGLVSGYIEVRHLAPKKYFEGRDWLADAAAVRKHFPGIDPSALTIVQFTDILLSVPTTKAE